MLGSEQKNAYRFPIKPEKPTRNHLCFFKIRPF